MFVVILNAVPSSILRYAIFSFSKENLDLKTEN